MTYIEEKSFNKINFQTAQLQIGEYDNCVFNNCDFSNADLSEILFSDCEFIECNLSLTKLINTAFRDIKFNACKILGLHFENCNEFGLSFLFDSCLLNNSSFFEINIKKTIFKNSQLQELDFTGCNLTGSSFLNCDLTGSIFNNSILEKVDFRTSSSYSIDPENNRIRKAKFSLQDITGLLDKHDIVIEK